MVDNTHLNNRKSLVLGLSVALSCACIGENVAADRTVLPNHGEAAVADIIDAVIRLHGLEAVAMQGS
jgi:hypothetical protein